MTNNLKINLNGIRNALINYLIPLACLAGIVLVVLFVFKPSYKAIPSLKTELGSKIELEAILNTKLDSLNKLVDYKSVVDEDSNLLNKILVSEEKIPALLTQADKIATESGLQVTRLSYSLSSVGAKTDDPKENSSYQIVEISMGVSGSFDQLKAFLMNLEVAARMINVETLRYSADDKDGIYTYTATLTLHSPYLFVESTAVTDEPVNLDISDTAFIKLINKIKAFKFYDPDEVNTGMQLIETEETEETTRSSIFL